MLKEMGGVGEVVVESGGAGGDIEGAEGEFGVEGSRERERARSVSESLRALKLGRFVGSGSQQDLMMSYLKRTLI